MQTLCIEVVVPGMARKYEIKTMKKDIEGLRKKMKISDSELVELLGKEEDAPPEKLPVVESVKPIEPPKPEKEPEKPIEIEKPSSPPRPPEPEVIKPSRPQKSILPVVIVVLILLIVGGGVYYWWNYLRVPKEEPPVEKPEVKIPTSFIEVDETKIIELKEEDDVLFEKLKEVAGQEQELGNFQRILVKKIGKEKDYFLSFQEIAGILYINIPYNISSELDLGERHTLFIYAQDEGSRLGVIVKVSDFENLVENLKSWEKNMQTDIRPIFLGRVLGFPATEEFQDNIYPPDGEAGQEVNIRYLNFSDPTLTVDYAVAGDYLIITTSRESIYKVIDKILGE